jgi:hypothetical protein
MQGTPGNIPHMALYAKGILAGGTMINTVRVEADDMDTTFSNVVVSVSPEIEQWLDKITMACGPGLNQEGLDRLYYQLGRVFIFGVKIGVIKGKYLR